MKLLQNKRNEGLVLRHSAAKPYKSLNVNNL
jgi:hypothetical protein